MPEQISRRPLVIQPGESEAYWQPVPANGYVELRVSRRQDESIQHFDTGVQVVAPGGYVREHQHNDQEELILVYEGEGRALVNGQEYPMQAGTTLYLAPHSQHKFINTGETELKFFWVFMPGGLSDFFERIGRKKSEGEVAPEPFDRPKDVETIEKATVFGQLGS